MDRRKQRFKKRTAVTKEQALNFLCANEAAEQNREAHQCGKRNSNGITQPSGAATPQNGDAHGARLRSEGSLLLSDVPSVHAKMAKYALLTAARAEVPDHAAHAEGSDTTPSRNTCVSACEPLCARLGDWVACVPAAAP